MDIKFTVQVPEECRKWILLQRLGLERFISSGNFDIMYSNGLWEDYHGLLPYLPDKVASILDIGCGVGGIDVLLYHHYQNPEIHLMDGDGLGDNKYGYFDRIDFYNSPPSTLALLQLNGVYSNQIRWHKPDPESRISADIIISLFSCGFHYPITMYAPLVRKSLKPGGIAVFDVRRKENAELSGFVELGRLENHEKSQRVIYTRSDVGK